MHLSVEVTELSTNKQHHLSISKVQSHRHDSCSACIVGVARGNLDDDLRLGGHPWFGVKIKKGSASGRRWRRFVTLKVNVKLRRRC
jgi:hypothetical protein